MSEQLALDMPAQRRRVTPEPAELYAAVRLLRRCGYSVHRAGDGAAMVDGVVRGNEWVLCTARRYGVTGVPTRGEVGRGRW